MERDLFFYKVMEYPEPVQEEKFYFMPDTEKQFSQDNGSRSFSRKEKNIFLEDYISHINKFGWIYRSIPFLKNICLCNSITFNALKEDSDIDIFLICKSGRIWLCKLFSSLLFLFSGIKRRKNKTKKRFCLCFFVTEDYMNLYNISLKPYDIYLIYWIAHLVPVYEEKEGNKDKFFHENTWVQNFLSNLPLGPNINLGNKIFRGNSWFKNFFEKIFGGKIGTFFEKLVKGINLPIMLIKKKRLGEEGKNIIISDGMMKFIGNDIRKKINLLYKMKINEKKKESKK